MPKTNYEDSNFPHETNPLLSPAELQTLLDSATALLSEEWLRSHDPTAPKREHIFERTYHPEDQLPIVTTLRDARYGVDSAIEAYEPYILAGLLGVNSRIHRLSENPRFHRSLLILCIALIIVVSSYGRVESDLNNDHAAGQDTSPATYSYSAATNNPHSNDIQLSFPTIRATRQAWNVIPLSAPTPIYKRSS